MSSKLPLRLPCKRYLYISLFLAQLLGLNKFLLYRRLMPYQYALKIQSGLLQVWVWEQKRLCKITFRVLEESFATGEIPSDEDCLEYFRDLKALEAEGRYEVVLHQLYCSRKSSEELNKEFLSSDYT